MLPGCGVGREACNEYRRRSHRKAAPNAVLCLGWDSEESMPRKQQVKVEPRPDGRWAVQTDTAQRADSLHDRKSEAVKRGRERARDTQTELVIKGEDGRVAGKDSHGADPPNISG